MAQGTLAVQLTIGGAEPITSGKVVISDDTGQELYTLYTNESGKTIPVTLEAPPAEYSLGVGEPQPYSSYNIRITADGFKDVVINGVQIFAGTEALQNVAMTAGEGEIVINIPPPVLWGDYPEKEPEEEVKEIPPETGFVVLDRVVIPEYVVVKDGPPSGGGDVYYVPYKDYIKNVASSEIYSTWDEAAIRANVLAIQSFVLNRVLQNGTETRAITLLLQILQGMTKHLTMAELYMRI